MSLRLRAVNVGQVGNSENVIGKTKTAANTVSRERSALGEIGNVQARRLPKTDKENGGKNVILKPTLAKNVSSSTLSTVKPNKMQLLAKPVVCKTSTVAAPVKAAFRVPSASTLSTVSSLSVAATKHRIKPLGQRIAAAVLPPQPAKVKTHQPVSSRVKEPVFPNDASFNDVDKETENSPFFVGEYAGSIYAYMQKIEDKYMLKMDFLQGQAITSKMRALVIDWLVDVQQQYNILLETLELSVAIFDRFLQKHRTIEKTQLQLVGITSMWIACKYEELFAPELENFVYITDYTYTRKDILKMEVLIHRTLDFAYGQPLSIHFLRRYTNTSRADGKHHTFAKYFLEIALISYKMRSVKMSILAAISLHLSFCLFNDENKSLRELWPSSLQFYSTYTFDDLQPHIAPFAKTIIEAESSKLQAVQKKYASSKRLQASKIVYNKENLKILKKIAGIQD